MKSFEVAIMVISNFVFFYLNPLFYITQKIRILFLLIINEDSFSLKLIRLIISGSFITILAIKDSKFFLRSFLNISLVITPVI